MALMELREETPPAFERIRKRESVRTVRKLTTRREITS